jgi:transposase
MIRMLIVGYIFAIRSERALCRDVQVNLAYRWFCGKHPVSTAVTPAAGVLLRAYATNA